MILLLTDCKCKSPPCTCTPDIRENTCGFRLQGNYVEEERKLGTFRGYQMIKCGADGTLRDDCNTFFQEKLVLCEEHYPIEFSRANRKCGICQTAMRDCTC